VFCSQGLFFTVCGGDGGDGGSLTEVTEVTEGHQVINVLMFW